MIDGVRQVDDPPHDHLRLTYVAPDGTEQPLSGPGPELNELHPLRAPQPVKLLVAMHNSLPSGSCITVQRCPGI